MDMQHPDEVVMNRSKQRRPTPGEVERRLPLHQSLELCKEIGKKFGGFSDSNLEAKSELIFL
jgi:hypothetical protein